VDVLWRRFALGIRGAFEARLALSFHIGADCGHALQGQATVAIERCRERGALVTAILCVQGQVHGVRAARGEAVPIQDTLQPRPTSVVR